MKFLITDPSLFWSLQTIDQLGPYSLSTRKILEIEDAYLDTKKRRLFAAGYSCRRRNQDNGVMITLASLPAHQREIKHWETLLERNTPRPVDWPESEVRRRLVKVLAERKLRPILNLYQTRIVRTIRYDGQKTGRFDLDQITLIIDGEERHFKQLRINLLPAYADMHLEKVTALILEKWPLEVETLSKFERALLVENYRD